MNLELTVDSLNIEGIESKHEHVCDKDRRQHNDSDTVSKISGSAALKGGMDLSFDMSEEEMKGSYQMIQELGKSFANRGQKITEFAQKVVDKVNDSNDEQQISEASQQEDELIADGEQAKELIERYNSKPSKAAYTKANDFGRKFEMKVEKYLNEVDSPLVEIEDLYENLCSKRREMRQAEAARG
jgi:hypothetical protein